MGKRENEFRVDSSKPWFNTQSGWPEEVPKNIDFPIMSLGEMLERTAEKYPDSNAMWFLDEWMTFDELKRNVDALATALHLKGITKGDCVALLLPNSFQYVISYYACVKLGAIPSGINPTYKAQEVLHQLKIVDAKAVIFLDALFQTSLDPILSETNIKILIATNIADFISSQVKRILGKLLKKIPSGNYSDDALDFK
jgi:long-chain acyl-CoA synthetase